MILEINNKTINIANFSFSESTAWLTINGETTDYETLKSEFSGLDVDAEMIIKNDEGTFLESHTGFNYLSSITYVVEKNTYNVQLIKEPLSNRIKALEDTVDELLMADL